MKTTTRFLQLALCPLVASACASSKPAAATDVRFANRAIVTRVADREHVATMPTYRKFLMVAYQVDGSLYGRVDRALSLPRPQRAKGVNALDEVPDSTWFTNRNTKHKLTPEEVKIGPARSGNPEDHLPWTILSTKSGGVTPGLVIKDARGDKYILKFDLKGFPETETAAGVITNRLLYAAGLNVPEDYVVIFTRQDLRIVAGSRYKDLVRDRQLKNEDLDDVFELIEMSEDGKIRGMASKIVDGVALGGHPGSGVRRDDPNDVIPHELRRDLRGLYPVFAWLDQTDVKESNTLDVYAVDPKEPSRSFLTHYHIDFGSALGTMAATKLDQRRGYVYAFDPAASMSTFFGLGIAERSWEDRARPSLRGLGLYEAHGFDPGAWKPYTPSYLPMLVSDRIDKYWGAKLVMSFTPAQIRAAIAAGRLSDPVAAEYLAQQMIARQRVTGLYWFSRVNPLDNFRVKQDGGRVDVCFDDLMLTNHLVESAANTNYLMVTNDRTDTQISTPFSIRARSTGHMCTGPLTVARDGDGYTILKMTTRGRGNPLSTHVHIARDRDTGMFRVIGVYRR